MLSGQGVDTGDFNATNFALGTAAEHKLGNDWTDIRSKFPAFVAYPWWVGGGFSGEDNSAVWDGNGDTLFTNTVHLSTRDLSAIKEGFTLITIGDGTTYRMIFGDALMRQSSRQTEAREIVIPPSVMILS